MKLTNEKTVLNAALESGHYLTYQQFNNMEQDQDQTKVMWLSSLPKDVLKKYRQLLVQENRLLKEMLEVLQAKIEILKSYPVCG